MVVVYRLFRRSTGSYLSYDYVGDMAPDAIEEMIDIEFPDWEVIGTSIMTNTCLPNCCGEYGD